MNDQELEALSIAQQEQREQDKQERQAMEQELAIAGYTVENNQSK